MKVKSKEVAEALGVSTATVSLAINGKPGVNEETRKRILEYISGQQGKDVTKGTFVKLIIFENSPRVLSGGDGVVLQDHLCGERGAPSEGQAGGQACVCLRL